MGNIVLAKNWQDLFLIDPSKIIVVDRKGQRTADGDTEKYDNQYNFSYSASMNIRAQFRLNFAWTEGESKITIAKAEIVPTAFDRINLYGKTTEQVEDIRKHSDSARGIIGLTRLSYTNVGDKTQKEQILPIGIFLKYNGDLKSLALQAGYSLMYSTNEDWFKNVIRQACEKQLLMNTK